MNLFPDDELFQSYKRSVSKYDLPDTDLTLIDGFIPKADADRYYKHLLANTNWREYSMDIYGKTMVAPRMVAWYEDANNPGANPKTPPFNSELNEIRQFVQNQTGIYFNSVLLNLYRNGSDGVGWHSDKEENFGKNAIIASVSFGETRMFKLRHKFKKDLPVVEIPLHHGAFLLMAGTTQSFWQHQIPKTVKDQLPRINLTFRQVKRQLP